MKRTIDAHEYIRDCVMMSNFLRYNMLCVPCEEINPIYNNIIEYYKIHYWKIAAIKVEYNIISIDLTLYLNDTNMSWRINYYVTNSTNVRIEHDTIFKCTLIEGVGFLTYDKLTAVITLIAKKIVDDRDVIYNDSYSYQNINFTKLNLHERSNTNVYKVISINEHNFNEICIKTIIDSLKTLKIEHCGKAYDLHKNENSVFISDNVDQLLINEDIDLPYEDILELFKTEYVKLYKN